METIKNLRYIGCWCDRAYTARWKDMERRLHEQPIQNMLGDEQTFKKMKSQLDPIIKFTLEIWYKRVKKQKLDEDIKVLRWVPFDSKFEPAKSGKGFQQWSVRGMTAWCTLIREGQLPMFGELKDEYGLDDKEFFMYLQLRDYYIKEIKGKVPREMNGVVQLMINKYNGERIGVVSGVYQKLMDDEKHTTDCIREKWEREFGIEITGEDWTRMWRTHYLSTNSRIWREF